MRRRRFMVLGGTVLLAGCGGDGGNGDDGNGDGDDPSPTAEDNDSNGSENDDGSDSTPEGVENQTGEDRDVGGSGDFQPSVTYNSCTEVTVDADEPYSAVAIGLVDGSNEMHNDGYEGENTFEADQTIDEVLVWSENGDKSNKVNPSVESCPGPE